MEALKNIGGFILGFGVLFLVILVSAFMINGALWVGEHVLPWLANVAWLLLAIDLLVFLPLTLFRKTRLFGGLALFFSSYIFGLTVWFLGLLQTYFMWGFIGVFIGLMLGGVGVVPVAMLASLLGGEFLAFFIFVVLLALTFGSRVLGMYLATLAEENSSGSQKQDSHYESQY